MDPSAPMILPKGIVINTTNIYKEVAGYSTIPADKIWEYWHVYTVTNKKLKDPTARRLENFWWQVWGSDRRYLSGQALARLYEDISVGPTAVPLHGPPNRWEGPDVPALTKELIVAHVSGDVDESQNFIRPVLRKSNDTSTSLRSLSSSASKPPPAHPILKKDRSPLSSGPRPTARFASPPESTDEESEIPSSGSTATTGLEMPIFTTTQPSVAAAQPHDSASPARRPQVPRRTSPQSQPESNPAARKPSTLENRRGSSQLRTVSPIPEQPANNGESESDWTEDSISSRSVEIPSLSAKAAGKQPALPRSTATGSLTASKRKAAPTISTTAATNSDMKGHPSPLSPATARPTQSLSRKDTDTSSTTGSMTDSGLMMGRSISQNGYMRKGSAQGLFTGATASTTNVAAQGTIIDQAGSVPSSNMLDSRAVESSLGSVPTSSSLLDGRMMPTPPSQAASVPMGRTRSQLTLLLEREKTRTGDKPRSKS